MNSLDANLSNCDRSEIKYSHQIQNHGYLVGFDLVSKIVRVVSENISDISGSDGLKYLGQKLPSLLGKDLSKFIAEHAERMSVLGETHKPLGQHKFEDNLLDVYIFKSGKLFFIEFEKITKEDDEMSVSHQFEMIKFLDKIRDFKDMNSVAKAACKHLREITGYDRVMLYKFLENWDGEVIAEDKTPSTHSYLNHRFPATDIPLPARELYLINRNRQIYDIETEPVNVLTDYSVDKTLDLTHSKFRSPAKIHVEYMRNMSVQSSFSVAVISNEKLWGLFACHAGKPVKLSQSIRLISKTVGSALSVFANTFESSTKDRHKNELNDRLKSIFDDLKHSDKPSTNELFKNSDKIFDVFKATGMAYMSGEEVHLAGLTPPRNELLELKSKLLESSLEDGDSPILTFESLTAIDEKWAYLKDLACGLIATSIQGDSGSMFILFRPEIQRTVVWGGDPDKQLSARNYNGEINPRKSFASWTEKITNRSNPWGPLEIQAMAFFKDIIFETLILKEKVIQDLTNH